MTAKVIDFSAVVALRSLVGKAPKRASRDSLDIVAGKLLAIMLIASGLEKMDRIRLEDVCEAQAIAADALLEINAVKHYPFLPMAGQQASRNQSEVLVSAREAAMLALELLQGSSKNLPSLSPILDTILVASDLDRIEETIAARIQARVAA
jgi:hypothetical protein